MLGNTKQYNRNYYKEQISLLRAAVRGWWWFWGSLQYEICVLWFSFLCYDSFNFLTLFNRRFCTSCTKINFFATVGAQTSILSQGTQKINEQVIDLSGKEDFKGLWVAPMLGIKSRFDASDLISLFISYEFMPMFNVTDNEEDFKIRQNPLTLGIRLWL